MSLAENLIKQRMYFFISEIEEILDEYIENPILTDLDIELCLLNKELFLQVGLNNNCTLIVKEEYSLEHHRLTIQYNYTLLSSFNKPIVSYDNSPHHPTLETFPHHKHFYPKSKYDPVSFNGDFIQAIQEIQWIMDNKLYPG